MSHSPRSAVLKREIEAQLASRIPAALSPQAAQALRQLDSGIPEIDSLVGGGLPIGGITEFTGLGSSGRTSLAYALLARATAESVCAYIDVDDTMDPRSSASAGVNHRNLLWVRVAKANPGPTAACPSPSSISKLGPSETGRFVGGHCGSNHPRTETKGLDVALERMLTQKTEARLGKMEGTPGYPNRKLGLAAAPKEQVAFEHFNARRADESDPIRRADQRAANEAHERSRAPIMATSSIKKFEKPWSRLDRAIRATDQILQSGGFRVVVLDLASVPPEQALRIPSATWFRFRRAAQGSDAIFLLLTQVACARSSAICVLYCSVGTERISGNLLNGFSRTAEVARQRLSSPFAKKSPGRAVTWDTTFSWMRAAGE
ncbi:recombinase A [Tunturiibacter gelidoferens]|uniref:Protein RecA n=1 Tax=Tunturiibacter lichenicola TaxID=2051959 RepID=A0A7Y9NR25_9BACT|nr:recombinase A [Edaphobacter lichenicola]NYF53976.1 recombination protein RecA [Edaphobacter lichenicola]